MNKDADKFLYKFEYYEELDNETYTDWVWLEESEVADYRSSYQKVDVRKATLEEASLYEDAYSEGYGMAAVLEFESKYDGITFRIELNEDGNLSAGRKMFQCAVCDEHLDFEEKVAAIGEMYLGVVKEDKLWHVCRDCA